MTITLEFILLIVLIVLIIVQIINTNASIKKASQDQQYLLTEVQRLNKENREELSATLSRFSEFISHNFKNFQDSSANSISLLTELQKERLDQLEKRQNEMILNTEKKLEQIRGTVEEKLEKTLSERLGRSFETVGKQLIEVQKGLGEMQVLAQDVGGLKRVLSNVKMRGGIGEVQLSMLLENILAPDQYETNVKTKSSGRDFVEFAIKLPGKDDSRKHIWLPVDAKFPKEYYESLQNAYDSADIALIEREQKNLEAAIKNMAKDISAKYIDPPATTDFAIMFLPFEGIYAEVVRRSSLLEEIQNKYKVLVTGPTTFAAILNSLQMGFRTLAIEKRSGEVWNVLATVKKEFSSFGDLLTKAQKNIQGGLDDIDKLVGVRTRAIQRRLRNIEGFDPDNGRDLTEDSSDLLLGGENDEDQ
ncbi:MAG: DNA recombination protein RmuC [Bacteroidales bacterium]